MCKICAKLIKNTTIQLYKLSLKIHFMESCTTFLNGTYYRKDISSLSQIHNLQIQINDNKKN